MSYITANAGNLKDLLHFCHQAHTTGIIPYVCGNSNGKAPIYTACSTSIAAVSASSSSSFTATVVQRNSGGTQIDSATFTFPALSNGASYVSLSKTLTFSAGDTAEVTYNTTATDITVKLILE